MYVQRLLNHGQQQVDFVEECAEKDSECSFFFLFLFFFFLYRFYYRIRKWQPPHPEHTVLVLL